MVPLRFHLASDTIDEKDITALVEWLREGPRLTKGPLTVEFENRWSRLYGRAHSVFCNSGSSANLLMYYALRISGRLRNNTVIVPATGWVTTVAPAIQFGFEPVMCDCDPDTWALDPGHLEELLKKHDPALVTLVHVLGVPADLDRVLTLKKRYNFLLMEDACAALGASYKNRFVGSFGEMGSYSLYFGHQMSTIEGGIVSTDDKELSDLLLMARSHGWSKDLDPATHERLVAAHRVDDFHSPFVFYHPGFNLRSTDLNAFLGLRQVEKAEWIRNRREENHARYLELLGGRLRMQKAPEGARICSIHTAVVAEDREARRRIVTALVENGIETRIFSASNLGRHPFWTSRYGEVNLPHADRLFEGGLFLPNHPSLSLDDVEFIAETVRKAL